MKVTIGRRDDGYSVYLAKTDVERTDYPQGRSMGRLGRAR